MYNSGTLVRYKSDILGDHTNISNISDTSTTKTTTPTTTPNINNHMGTSKARGTTTTTAPTTTLDTSNKTTMSDITRTKWVMNLSSTPLTKTQETLLARGPNFEVVPKYSPRKDYSAAVEEVCGILCLKRQQSIGPKHADYETEIPPNATSARMISIL